MKPLILDARATGGTVADAVARAAGLLASGGIVAFPTETVYGLAVRRDLRDSVERLYRLKGRPSDKPFAVHLPDAGAIARYVPSPPDAARRLMNVYWPGPLTLVLETPTGETVGLRLPAHRVAQDLLRAVEFPVVGTSANPSGSPPAVTADEVVAYFGAEIDAVLDAGPTELKAPSTVVRVDESGFRVLREGFIDASRIEERLSRGFLFVCSGNSCRSPIAESLFRKRLAERLETAPAELAAKGLRVQSAGLMASAGGGATPEAIDVLRDYKVDLSRHRTRALAAEMVEKAERIVVMTRDQESLLRRLYPAHASKIRTLHPLGRNVDDPFGHGRERYVEVAREIDAHVRKLIDEIFPEVET